MADAPKKERDGCVVESRALSRLLHEYAGRYAQRNNVPNDITTLSLIKMIVSRTQDTDTPLSEGTVENLFKLDENGQPCGRYLTTELWIADAVVTAIERPDVFYDGDPPTLVVYQNPQANAGARAACCGVAMPPRRRRRHTVVQEVVVLPSLGAIAASWR